MRELGLHILDIVENAIESGARQIDLTVDEDLDADRLTITVRDNGRGMDAATAQKARDPFFTTRSTRHVGLGIPLFAAAAERCGGGLSIESAPGRGTTVQATFQYGHIDRAPLGDMCSTLICILMHQTDFDLRYKHQIGERAFELDTQEIKSVLGGVPLAHPDVRKWLSEFIAQGEQELKEA